MYGIFTDKVLKAPKNGGFKMDGYWVWCPSVIKAEDNRYHMFASRWKKEMPMHPGWLVGSEIVRAVADTPEGPYHFEEVILTSRGPQYWDGRSVHNPTIRKVGDTYVLYYIGTTHPFPELADWSDLTNDDPRTIVARSNKRIGMATAKSIFGPWERRNEPILTTRPNHFDNFLVSNPAPLIKKDGSVLMVYKCREYKHDLYQKALHSAIMQFGIAKSESFNGKYTHLTDKPIFDSEYYDIEDPFIWEGHGRYHMIAKDMIGNICGEKSGGFYASSINGEEWDMAKGKLAYSRHVLWDDGTLEEMGNMERPFILFDGETPTHLFFATSDSPNGGGIMACKNTWNMVIPLK
jgi:hypothetical protein